MWIGQVHREFDVDRSGTISKAELQELGEVCVCVRVWLGVASLVFVQS